jgi:hypothetical protein
MANAKRVWEIVGLVGLIFVLIGLAAGGSYWWISSENRAEIDQLNKKITALQKTTDNKDESGAEEEVETDANARNAANPGDYDGWKTYTNPTLGYKLKYPADWTFEQSKDVEMDMQANYVTFYNDDWDYAFSFGLRPTGSNTLLSGRTGLGVGEFESGGTVTVLGQSIAKQYFVTDGRVSVIFYGAGTPGIFTIVNNEIAAELGVPGYEDKSLKGSDQEKIADKIITSLSL